MSGMRGNIINISSCAVPEAVMNYRIILVN
jgi:hypothetical protein